MRVVVVGLGAMGSRHARVALKEGFTLEAVVDPRKASDLAPSFASIHELEDVRGRLAIVATDVDSHYEIARALLDRGARVLLEKPMCATVTQARALASARGLAVGHVERFNPGFVALERALPRIGEIQRVTAVRTSARATARTLLSDLAVHDIDLALRLVPELRLARARRDGAELRAPGVLARVTARRAAEKLRAFEVVGERGRLSADLARGTCALDGAPLEVEAVDALGAQLRAFASEDFSRLCSPLEAARALEIAHAAQARGEDARR